MSSRGWRLGALGVAAIGFFFLFETAEHGAALVYRHGLGVSPDATLFVDRNGVGSLDELDQGAMPDPDVRSRLIGGDDGSLAWSPLESDSEALGSIIFPVAGFPLGAVAAIPSNSIEPGLELMVLDRSILVFGSSFGDVRVEAELELDQFSGRAGVAHHVASSEQASWFEIEVGTSGGSGAALRLTQGGSVLTLEAAPVSPNMPSAGGSGAGPATIRIAVSSAGKHLKGMINGEVVAHGHIDPPEPGKVGLLLDGKGRVRVKRLVVEPIGS